MPTLEEIEKHVRKVILPDLRMGRLSDREHTLAVVKYLKNILRNDGNLKDDLVVLVISAYAHDWGYTNLFDDNSKLTLKEIGDQKDRHMVIGANKIKNVLEDKFFDFMNNKQKERCIHLVGVHDRLDLLKDRDELLLMEADTLGGLDPKIMGTFNTKESEDRFLQKNRDLRYTKFITKFGKKKYEELYKSRLSYSNI